MHPSDWGANGPRGAVAGLGAQVHCHDDRPPAGSELVGVHHGVRLPSAALLDTALQRLAVPFEHKRVAKGYR
eukprot:9792830-Lingulodinium_polyedra.AAC.1